MKIYLASPFFTESQLEFVKDIELALDSIGVKYFSPRSEGILIDMTPEQREEAFKEIYKSNVNNMDACDIMVANIDDYDAGTMYEVGWFSKSSKPIFSVSNSDYGLNVMLREAIYIHNTDLDNLIINIMEHKNNEPITIFDELTKNVT